MNRKDFFRGLVGTAVMASLPAVLKPEEKAVFDHKKLQARINEIYKDSTYAYGNAWEQTRALCNKLQK